MVLVSNKRAYRASVFTGKPSCHKIHNMEGVFVVDRIRPLGTHVIICDWHGVIKWISGDGQVLKQGDYLWKNASANSVKTIKSAFGRVVALQENAVIEVTGIKGRFCRLWMWPLESPEMAVCILGMVIPKELKQLSPKERQALDLIAQGQTAKQVADILDISLSSVHTHLRRAREKLSLESTDALIGFAARYCQPGWEAEEAPSFETENPVTKLRAH
jgi:DNA-binding CsgD family transcriptional regulator